MVIVLVRGRPPRKLPWSQSEKDLKRQGTSLQCQQTAKAGFCLPACLPACCFFIFSYCACQIWPPPHLIWGPNAQIFLPKELEYDDEHVNVLKLCVVHSLSILDFEINKILLSPKIILKDCKFLLVWYWYV